MKYFSVLTFAAVTATCVHAGLIPRRNMLDSPTNNVQDKHHIHHHTSHRYSHPYHRRDVGTDDADIDFTIDTDDKRHSHNSNSYRGGHYKRDNDDADVDFTIDTDDKRHSHHSNSYNGGRWKRDDGDAAFDFTVDTDDKRHSHHSNSHSGGRWKRDTNDDADFNFTVDTDDKRHHYYRRADIDGDGAIWDPTYEKWDHDSYHGLGRGSHWARDSDDADFDFAVDTDDKRHHSGHRPSQVYQRDYDNGDNLWDRDLSLDDGDVVKRDFYSGGGNSYRNGNGRGRGRSGNGGNSRVHHDWLWGDSGY